MNKPNFQHKHKYADYNRVKGRKWLMDTKKICINNKVYNLNYNVSIASDNNFLVLEEQGASNITCNLDPSSLLITFPSRSSMNQFASQIKPVTTFITSRTSTFFCHNKPLLRRVFAAEEYTGSTNTLLLSLSDSKYDEIFDKAHISFGTSLETCNQPADPKVVQTYPSLNGDPSSAHFCLGLNTNQECTNSSQPIQLYNNQYITITCQDCFFALTGDVFLEVHIDLFECLSFSGGFVNLEMLGALILQLQAHLDWSAGINKNLPIGGEINLLNFYIGPIPVHLYFLLDLGLVLNSQFDFTATATIGTSFNYTWNDWYVKWGLLSGWEHVHPAPVITWTPVVSGEAGFQASTTFSLVPSYGFHVDNFFSTTYNFDPSITAAAQWNTTTNVLCAELTYASALTVSSQLSLNIPFSSKQTTVWGPRTIWQASGTIGKYCS